MQEPRIVDKIVYLTEKRDVPTAKERVINFLDRLLLGKQRERIREIELESRIARVAGRLDHELGESLSSLRGHFSGRIRQIMKEEMGK